MSNGAQFFGKTVEEAIAEGLRSLGLTQDQVTIDILSRGSRGLFGIGSEPAQVRITPRPAAQSEAKAPPSEPAIVASGIAAEPLPAAEALSSDRRRREESSAPPPVTGTASHDAPNSTSEDNGTSEDNDAPAAGGDEDGVDDETLVALAVELLGQTVQLMGFDAEVVASWQEPDADNDDPYLLLNLEGQDLGALIGRRGETLGNLQYLLRLMVNQRLHQWKNIVVDVEKYRQHRAEHLVQLAQRSAEQVARTGRPLSLEPMPANERRIIHLALRDHPQVYTESSGEGERRKIQLIPRRSV